MSEDFLEELSDSEEAASSSLMSEITALVEAWEKAKKDVEEKEAQFKAAKEIERKISEQLIPDLFTQNKQMSVTLMNGLTVSIKEDLAASIPEDEEAQKKAFEWLSSHGGADLIKDTISIPDPTKGLLDFLEETSMDFDRAKKVNGSSLKAWLRGALGMAKKSVAILKPEDVPPELHLYRFWKTSATRKG